MIKKVYKKPTIEVFSLLPNVVISTSEPNRSQWKGWRTYFNTPTDSTTTQE